MKKLILLLSCISAQLMGMKERPAKKPRTEIAALLADQIQIIIVRGDIEGLRELFISNPDFFQTLSSAELEAYDTKSSNRYREFKARLNQEPTAQARLNASRSIRNLFRAIAQMPSFDGIQSYFSNPRVTTPSTKPDEVIKHLVGTEQEKITGCMFHLTLFDLAKRMIKQRTAQGNPISIDLLIDYRFGDFNCQAVNHLVANGAQVSIPATSEQQKYEQMHHKFYIFFNTLHGKRILVTGSCNATGYAAANSWDNIILIDDSATIDRFIEEFNALKSIGRRLTLAECKKKSDSSYTSLRNDRVPEGSYDSEGRFSPHKIKKI